MNISDDKLWHHLPSEEVIKLLETSSNTGLKSAQLSERQQHFGPNILPVGKSRSLLQRFLLQFHNTLIYVLLLASMVTAFLQHWIDTSVILGVVIINAIIGFIQEGKAENALRAIKNMLSIDAMVIRDGHQLTVPTEILVPGDIVILQSGDKVPADLRLFHVKGFQVQEASLTGESQPIEKTIKPVDKNSVLGDRLCMAYSGTIVTHGQVNRHHSTRHFIMPQ